MITQSSTTTATIPTPILVAATLASLLIGLLVALAVSEPFRRRRRLQSIARRSEMTLDSNPGPLPDLDLEAFREGARHQTVFTLGAPESNASILRFSYKYREVSRRGPQVTCALVELPFRAPRTTIRAQSVAGPHDRNALDLLASPDQARHNVFSDDPVFAAELFTPEVSEALANSKLLDQPILIEFNDRWLFVECPPRTKLDDLPEFLALCIDIRSAIPASLTDQHPT